MPTLNFQVLHVNIGHRPKQFWPEIDFLETVIKDLRFSGEIQDRNNSELISKFDQALEVAISTHKGWRVAKINEWPKLDKDKGWSAKPDIVARSHRGNCIIIEIEKGNKYKVYDDMMKLCLFGKLQRPACGVLICPTNHPNRKARRNPFEYSNRALKLLRIAASASEDFLQSIALLGYTQSVFDGDELVHWDCPILNKLNPAKR